MSPQELMRAEAKMDWSACDVVETVEGRLSGAFVVRRSRVRPEDLLSNADLTAEELAEEFDLSVQDVAEILSFWRRHRRDLAPHH